MRSSNHEAVRINKIKASQPAKYRNRCYLDSFDSKATWHAVSCLRVQMGNAHFPISHYPQPISSSFVGCLEHQLSHLICNGFSSLDTIFATRLSLPYTGKPTNSLICIGCVFGSGAWHRSPVVLLIWDILRSTVRHTGRCGRRDAINQCAPIKLGI